MQTSASIPLTAALVALVFAALLDAQNRRGGRRMPRFKNTLLVEKFDTDGNGRLESAERTAAFEFITKKRADSGGDGRGRGREAASSKLQPRRIARSGVAVFPDQGLYDLGVVRTMFVDFPQPKWSTELEAFYRTDVEVPATLTVDGKEYPGVGVHYRGSSSYFTIAGRKKKSFAVAMDYTDPKQRLRGYKTLNLLNGHADPSFMRTVLFAHIAGHYVAVPKACFVHLVINGESWGLYIHDQQLNKDFLAERFQSRKGARWKIPPNFQGQSALAYLGDDPSAYEGQYQLKSAESKDAAWQQLIGLCKALDQTPVTELEQVLPKILDIDKALWFLALDNVLMDGDGYHYRGSDYALYLHPSGRFYPLFRDNNEAFNYGGGPGGFGHGGSRRGRTRDARLAPLALIDEARAPLVSKLLKVPAWRARYLANCRTILDTWLDWDKLGPLVESWRKQVEPIIAKDDKGLYGHQAFLDALGKGVGRTPGLQQFVDARRAFLIDVLR